MNYGDIKRRVKRSIGEYGTDLDEEVADAILDSISDIHGEYRWYWDRGETTVTARGRLTGECTVVKGSNTITLTSGVPATQALCDEYCGGLIELSGGRFYEIGQTEGSSGDFVQSTGVVTLRSGEVLEESASSVPYIIIQDKLTLPSEVSAVQTVVDPVENYILRGVKEIDRRRFWPNPFDGIGGNPHEYWMHGVDPSGNLEMGVYPPPTEDRTYHLQVWLDPRYPSNDSDDIEVVTGIPARFHPVIVERAKEKMYEYERESEVERSLASANYLRGLRKMKNFARPDPGAKVQMHSDRTYRHRDRLWDYDAHTDITGV